MNSISGSSTIDVNSIVSQLMQVERQPLAAMNRNISGLSTQLSSFGRLQSSLSSLQDAARNLNLPSTWSAAKAASSDPVALEASASAGAAVGNYSLSVSQLAASQSLSSISFSGPGAVLGGGSLQITRGTLGVGGTGFTPDPARTPSTITIAPGSTVAQVRDAINSAGIGVSASLINDASGTRLVLRSTESGALNGFTVGVTDDDGTGADAAGLSRLAFDGSGAARQMALNTQGRNALFNLDGLDLESPTNAVSGVVEGLTLNLKRTIDSASPVNIAVTVDNPAIREDIDRFVKAYNDLNKLIRDLTRFDEGTKTAGALQGNRTVQILQTQLRTALQQTVGVGSIGRLSDMGITQQRDGSLQIDDSKFNAAAANPAQLQMFFSSGDPNPANQGLARRIDALALSALGVDSGLNAAQESLRRRQTAVEQQRSRFEDRLGDIETRLRRQYSALDSRLASMNAQLGQVSRLG
jgi:flagellar hook-associated protein 2